MMISTKPTTIDETVDDIKKLQNIVEELLILGDKISSNKIQLKTLLGTMRKAEINSNFITLAEAAEALQCTPKITDLTENFLKNIFTPLLV